MPTLKRVSSAVAALALVAAGVSVLSPAAHADAAPVTSADIQPTETQENYTSWHQGATPGGRYASTTAGLVIEGKTQIIKGETALPAAEDLLAYASSSTIVGTGPVWHQIGFGLSDGTWTTLRAPAGEESGNWTTSQPIGGVAKNGSAPLETLLGDLTGTVTYASGGFYVDSGKRAIVSSYSVNGQTTSFALESMAGRTLVRDRVLATEIRPDESSYLGWHDGAAAGGRYETTPDGLSVSGKVQVLNGQEHTSSQVAQFVTSLSIEATGDVWFQVPVFYGSLSSPSFTTLRATPEMAAAGLWAPSRAIPGFAAGAKANIDDIALALGTHRVVGYGFFVDAGKQATVASMTGNGELTLFTPFVPSTEVPGAGVGDGAESTPPEATESLPVTPGGAVTLTAPEGVFEPGESVSVTMFSDPIDLGELETDPETGAVTGEVTIPADAPAGAHRVLLQGGNSYYWAPQEFTIAKSDGGPGTGGPGTGGPGTPGDPDGNGNGNGTGTGNGTGNGTGTSTAGKGSGSIAQTGGASVMLPVAVGGLALLGGAALLLRRRTAA